jgi:hypothetical protein
MGDLILAKYCGVTLYGVTAFQISSAPNGDYDVTLKFRIKTPDLVTHGISATIEGQKRLNQ